MSCIYFVYRNIVTDRLKENTKFEGVAAKESKCQRVESVQIGAMISRLHEQLLHLCAFD